MNRFTLYILFAMSVFSTSGHAQKLKSLAHKADSILTLRYQRISYDTAYIVRPQTKWTATGRFNLSGSRIEYEGVANELSIRSQLDADYKGTASIGINFLGLSLNLALNPAKLLGKYHDYEINLATYGNKFGGEISYQDASNFKGWHETEGGERTSIPGDILRLHTININAYYAFNHRRFSYPAAFSQSYIQRRPSGSFLLAASFQGQRGNADSPRGTLRMRLVNFGIGAGYGYNFVPGKGWLLHVSALPTFIVYSKTSLTVNDNHAPLHYHFPEVIITGRGAVIKNFKKQFVGMTMVFNFSKIGYRKSLEIHNTKWLIRTFYGVRF